MFTDASRGKYSKKSKNAYGLAADGEGLPFALASLRSCCLGTPACVHEAVVKIAFPRHIETIKKYIFLSPSTERSR